MSRVEVRFDGDARGAARAAALTTAGIRGVGAAARQEDAHVSRLGASIRSSLGGAAVLAAKAGAAGVLGLAGAVVFTGIRFDDLRQKSEIAFTTMLGSGEKAKGFLDNLAKFASATPFEFPDLIRASQRMLAMGFAADEVVPSLTAVGNASAALGGSAATIDTITFALGQMQSAGRVSAQDMNQLTQAGVNGWKYLADAAGVSIAVVRERSEKGMLDSRAAVKTILAGMERDFGGMMEKQSHTFSGLASTLKDTFTQVSGKVMAPFFSMATAGMEKLVKITSSPEFTAGVERFATALEKKAKVAAKAVVEFFHDHWGDIVAILKATWKAAGEGFDVLQKIWGYADAIVQKMGGWETAAKFILAGIFAAKLATIATKVGAIGTGLAGLSRSPFMVAVVLAVSAKFLDQYAEKLWAKMGGSGGTIGTDPGPNAPIGPPTTGDDVVKLRNGSGYGTLVRSQSGIDVYRRVLPKIGMTFTDQATGKKSAYTTTLPGDWHAPKSTADTTLTSAELAAREADAAAAAADAAARAAAARSRTTSGSDTADTGGGSGGGGSASKPSQVQVEKVAKGVVDLRERINAAIAARNTRAFDRYSVFGMGASDQAGPMSGFNADSIAADKARAEAMKARAKDLADGLATVTAANTARMADLVEKSIEAAKAALDKGRGVFTTSFGRLGADGLRAFDAATSRLQADLAGKLKDALGEIEKSRKALTAEEQAYADFRARKTDRALTAEEQAYQDFQAKRAADARAATRADVMAMADGADKTARLRELDLNDQERALADSAQKARAARAQALADQEQALSDSAAASRLARDQDASAKAAAAQTEYDQQKLTQDAARALERDHFTTQLDELATHLATRKISVDGANKAIAALFAEFGVDPTFKQAGIDAGDGFATGLREKLAEALASFEKLQAITTPGVPTTAGEALRVVFPNFRAFAAGGRVPGRYVGVADTVAARLTPGEEVIDRSLSAALRQFLAGQGRGGGDVYLDGNLVGRVMEPGITAAQARRVGYASTR